MIICPVCKKMAQIDGKQLVCENKHSFDIAKDGHINLLLSSKSGDKIGDNKEMVVARRNFLDKNYYKPLSDKLCNIILKNFPQTVNKFCVVDAGCGEGYYTRQVAQTLKDSNTNYQLIGVDISKHAVQSAAKRDKNTTYIVASSFDMPIKECSQDLVLSLFAPLDGQEFNRILKKDGKVIVAVPGENHLIELKEKIYNNAYKNDENKHNIDEFECIQKEKISYVVHIDDNQSIKQLFTMTPYAFKTSKEGIQRLENIESIEVTLEFVIMIFEKIGKLEG